jgi:hypothetical protein
MQRLQQVARGGLATAVTRHFSRRLGLPRAPSAAVAQAGRAADACPPHDLRHRSYHFASRGFEAAFERKGIPHPVDTAAIRRQAVEYLQRFDPKTWYSDPMVTLLGGERLVGGATVDTVDAFNRVNGRQVLATAQQVDRIVAHVEALKRRAATGEAARDLRDKVRAVERVFMTDLAGMLIGNQAVDFLKQDGVTEIEESLQANVVEQRMQDQLLADELAGRVRVCRAPAFVGCVSNFSNFLDLCRKVLRNLELGVPVVIPSRANTSQHMYRWVRS